MIEDLDSILAKLRKLQENSPVVVSGGDDFLWVPKKDMDAIRADIIALRALLLLHEVTK